MKKLNFILERFPSFLRRGGRHRRTGWFPLSSRLFSLYLPLFTVYILLFPSCLTVSRIERNCDKFAQICTIGKQVETKYRDTTIYVEKPIYIDKIIEVPVPGFRDSIIIRDSVRIVAGYAEMKSIHRQQGIIGVDASVYRSVFSVNAYLTDSTVLYNYRDTLLYSDSLKIYNAIKEKTSSSTVVVTKKFIPKFYKFTFWVFIIAIILAAAYIAWSVFFRRKIAGLLS